MTSDKSPSDRDHVRIMVAIRERLDLLEVHVEGLLESQRQPREAEMQLDDDSDGFEQRFHDFADNADTAIDPKSRRWLIGS